VQKHSFLNRPVAVLGQPMPMACLVLIVFVVVGSALLSLASRMGVPAMSLARLAPFLVMRGEIWRAVTWAFFEADGQNLVFGSLMLGVFGRDLSALWGGTRYLTVCAAIAAGAGLITTALGFIWADVYQNAYLSIWPLADALIVAWALFFPSRTILFMFVIPAAGRNLLYLTVGVTALFAIMYGFANFAPHFLAMGLMYVYVRGGAVIAAQFRLNRLLTPRKDTRGLKAVEGGWNKDSRKEPNGSGWVH
jgi:hypothetical protein